MRDKLSESYAPIFVGGTGRSGTTLMRVMLNAHSNLCAGPEFKMTKHIIKTYSLMKEGHSDTKKAYFLEQHDIEKGFALLIQGFFENFRKQKGAQRIVEKTPHNILWMKELVELFPKAKFIHMVRDGRDVVCSSLRVPWHKTVKAASKYWVKTVSQGLENAEYHLLAGKVKVVRYEKLVMEPEKTMQSVLAFLEEAWTNKVLNYAHIDRGYEPVEWSTKTVGQELYSTAIGRWKRELDGSDKEIAKDIMGELLIKLGYARNFSW